MSEENLPAVRLMPEGVMLFEDGSIVFEEFEEGDPRRGPHSLSVQNKAEALVRNPANWHGRKRNVFWPAVHLTVGRGYSPEQAGRRFEIDDSNISYRARKAEWVRPMAESDRRELSALVWLVGWERLDSSDAEGRAAWKAASKWRLVQEERAVWREKKRDGEPMKFRINDEIPDDAYFSEVDPKRDERRAVVDELDTKLGRLEAELRRRLQSRRGGADRGDRAGVASEEMGALAGGMADAGGGEESLAGVGASEPASA
jgi:hypothetical protein